MTIFGTDTLACTHANVNRLTQTSVRERASTIIRRLSEWSNRDKIRYLLQCVVSISFVGEVKQNTRSGTGFLVVFLRLYFSEFLSVMLVCTVKFLELIVFMFQWNDLTFIVRFRRRLLVHSFFLSNFLPFFFLFNLDVVVAQNFQVDCFCVVRLVRALVTDRFYRRWLRLWWIGLWNAFDMYNAIVNCLFCYVLFIRAFFTNASTNRKIDFIAINKTLAQQPKWTRKL